MVEMNGIELSGTERQRWTLMFQLFQKFFERNKKQRIISDTLLYKGVCRICTMNIVALIYVYI